MSSIPATQRAWIIERRGRPANALKLRSDWAVPTKLKEGEVLVKIEAAALNPVGYKLMRILPNALARRPLPAEHDLSGVVVDASGTEFSPGDQVFGFISAELAKATGQGALAQYARVPSDYLTIRPPNISPIEASGIALVGQTAYQALIDVGKLEAGQTILINGGSSAVGILAIQIAKVKGAIVFATASTKNEEFVRRQGADHFIDYTKSPLHAYLTIHPPSPKFHLILDAVALNDPALYMHSPAYLAPNGSFITTGPMPSNMSVTELWDSVKTAFAALTPVWLGGIKRRYIIVRLKNKKSDLLALQKMLADGSLKPVVDSVYEFEDALKAYDRLLSHRATGKVVVKIDSTVN